MHLARRVLSAPLWSPLAAARVLKCDAELPLPGVAAALAQSHPGTAWAHVSSTADEAAVAAAAAAHQPDVLLTCYAPITAAVLAAAGPGLRGVVKFGVGIDAIDVAAARARGVPVVNVPFYADTTVAEHALFLLLALARRWPAVHAAVRASPDQWAWPTDALLGRDVSSLTVGVVGCGRIGCAFIHRARALGMRVLAYDPHPAAQAAALAAGAAEVCPTLAALLPACDAVSLHAALTPASRHLLGARELALLRPGAWLVNTARGALVDDAALAAALARGAVGALACDTFASEPLPPAHPLAAVHRAHPDRVLLTPHLAFFTAEAVQRLEAATLARVRELLAGRPVAVASRDGRLRAQTQGVVFVDDDGSGAA